MSERLGAPGPGSVELGRAAKERRGPELGALALVGVVPVQLLERDRLHPSALHMD